MADTVTCPTLQDYLNSEKCLENIGGTSSVLYVGNKADLKSPMVLTDNEYSTPEFNTGKGLYRFDLKNDTQQVQGESAGQNKGFNLTYDGTIDAVNKTISKLSRAFNNLDLFLIVMDAGTGDSLILYDPNKRVTCDSGGIKADTGKSSSDDRATTLQFKLNGVKYDTLYVKEPETGGWDSLLASASKASVPGT